ncbi:hypothetical protein [Streptomyces chattanoogensis]|uniref:hypothetical protein n=1 Tax=Streptomyces chattanoogensis TaxID=66876 RepID=UPI0036969B22
MPTSPFAGMLSVPDLSASGKGRTFEDGTGRCDGPGLTNATERTLRLTAADDHRH